jgi:hypothetical protein
MVKLANNRRCQSAVLRHLVWAAMEKIGKKELDSNMLAEGTSHTVSMNIKGTIDEQPFCETIESLVSIGHQQQKSSSINPQVAELIAWILGKLNRATRDRILIDLPQEFADNGMPESSPSLIDEVEHMLMQLRQMKTVMARGPIRCEYVLFGSICGSNRCSNCSCAESASNIE